MATPAVALRLQPQRPVVPLRRAPQQAIVVVATTSPTASGWSSRRLRACTP